jgi:hypothetical protein
VTMLEMREKSSEKTIFRELNLNFPFFRFF